MCGIIGYVGPRECKALLLHGLERLEYRGYDSAGIALLEADGLAHTRAVGNLQNLKKQTGLNGSPATTGLGHTRWATHGGVTEANAHPLATEDAGKLAIVLNGIVENYRELRERLSEEGHVFSSETDAETVTHLIEDFYEGDLVEAVRRRVRGARGPLRVRRHPPRPPGHAGRRPAAVPHGGGPRRGRGVPGLERGGLPDRDARRPVPERRGDRRHHAGRVPVPPCRGRRGDRPRGRRARLGHRGSREGGLRDLHAQGDPRAAGTRSRRRSATGSARAASCSRASGWTTTSSAS